MVSGDHSGIIRASARKNTLLKAGFPELSYFKGIFNGFRFRHHFAFVRFHRGYSIDVVAVVVVDFESVSSDQAILLEH
jgi:hypothetical protein